MRKIVILSLLTLLTGKSFAQNWDINLLREMNCERNRSLDKTFQVVSNSAAPIAIGTPAALYVAGLIRHDSTMKRKALYIGTTIVTSSIITCVAKKMIHRDRPFKTYGYIDKAGSGGSYSMPSGHTSDAFALATSLTIAYPKWYIITPAYLWAGAVGYSRIHLGVHYPSDVIAGALVGAGSAYASYKLNKWLFSPHRKHYASDGAPKRESFMFIKNIPRDLADIGKAPFQKANRKGLIIAAAATALLLPFDQKISDGVKKFSEKIHYKSEVDYAAPIRFGKTNVLKTPRNLNSAFYQLGEGGTSMLLAGGLFLHGKITKNERSLTTASQLTETFITMGVATQVLKRISGRQSPSNATAPGGLWRPLPSFKKFQQNTPAYDAYPSGHLATMMATVTVCAQNYPEKKWIKPLGYGLTGLTGLAMINADVHWASDYPLAIALGYLSAKITEKRNSYVMNKMKHSVAQASTSF